MKLYHGTNVAFDVIDGLAFYVSAVYGSHVYEALQDPRSALYYQVRGMCFPI